MPAPQKVSLPPWFELSDGMQIVVTAVDATSGATVSGVTVSNVSIDVKPLEASVTDADYVSAFPLLVPTS